ncbi:MAG: putative ATPase [Alphaproteobacteria bacterium]
MKTDHKEKLHIDINNVVSDFKKSLKNIFQAHNTNLTASLDKTNQEYQNTEKLLSPIRQKLKAQSGIDALQKQLNEEQKKLSELETLEKRDKEYRNKFIEYRQTINDLLKKRINAYKQFTEDASAFTKSINENSIETNIRFNFSEDLFLDQLKKKINKSKHKNIENDIGFEQIQNNFKNNQYDEFIGNLMDVQLKVTTLSENKIHLNYSGQEEMGVKKEVLLKIFSDYFKINYNVKYEGDTLKNMSTGTRSLFLLKLIMQLSNSRHPILIDQPEDDLDNSSVYHKLVEFIKTKKKERQIIIVTHNPNLVIGTDAEQVIVGQQSSNQSGKKFNYIYGAIENSFERNKDSDNIADHGIKQNICRILEGGDTAFLKREKRYGIN